MSGDQLANGLRKQGVIVAPGGPLGEDHHIRAAVRDERRRTACCARSRTCSRPAAGAGRGSLGASGAGRSRAAPAASPSPPIRGSHSSQLGRYQFQSPSSFIAAGSITPRMIVASIRTATARPSPSSLKSRKLSVTKTRKTPTITAAALVTVPAVVAMPCCTASSVLMPAVVELPDAGQDEHVVVHREPEQDHEQEQRQPVRDPAVRGEAEQALAVAVLEHEHEHAVGRPDRQQVQQDRLDRDHDRAERDQHQQEREPEHEREDQRQPAVEVGPEVLGRRRVAGHVDAGPLDLAHGRRHDVVAQLVERVEGCLVVTAPDRRDVDLGDGAVLALDQLGAAA